MTRIFVNIIRSLSSVPRDERGDTFTRLSDERIIASLTRMLRTGGQYPVLTNEPIIALALLATFGSGTRELSEIRGLTSGVTILHSLSLPRSPTEKSDGPVPETGLRALCSIVAPDDEDESVTHEIQANAVTLLDQLGKEVGMEADDMRSIVVEATMGAQNAGRPMASGLMDMVEIWRDEGSLENLDSAQYRA